MHPTNGDCNTLGKDRVFSRFTRAFKRVILALEILNKRCCSSYSAVVVVLLGSSKEVMGCGEGEGGCWIGGVGKGSDVADTIGTTLGLMGTTILALDCDLA